MAQLFPISVNSILCLALHSLLYNLLLYSLPKYLSKLQSGYKTTLLMLIAVLPILTAASNCYTKLNNLSAISASKINLKMHYNSLSNTYIFADTIKNKSNLKKDSLESDSNYLPRTSSAIKSKVNYKAKDSIVYSSDEKTATLYNTAEIEFEDLNMKSAKIKINLVKNTVNAIGELDSSGKKINTPIFKQGDAEYKIEEVTFN